MSMTPYKSYPSVQAFFKGELESECTNQNHEWVHVKHTGVKATKGRGHAVYILMQRGDEYRIDICTIKAVEGEKGQFSYRWYTEDEGPYHYGCPEEYLNKSTCQKDIAVEWRRKCLEKQVLEKAIKDPVYLKKGMKVELFGHAVVTFQFDNRNCQRGVFGALDTDGKLKGCRYSDITRIIQ